MSVSQTADHTKLGAQALMYAHIQQSKICQITSTKRGRTPELEPSELKRHEAVAELDDVYERIEIVRRHDETVALCHRPPAAHVQVAAQAVLQ